MGAGRKAATAIHEYLKQHAPGERRERRDEHHHPIEIDGVRDRDDCEAENPG